MPAKTLTYVASAGGFDLSRAVAEATSAQHYTQCLSGRRARSSPSCCFLGRSHLGSTAVTIAFQSCRNPSHNSAGPLSVQYRGPGCSSIGGGFLSELGPFYPTPGGSGLKTNKHAWNRGANVLFVDSPAYTGWSFSNDTSDLVVGEPDVG